MFGKLFVTRSAYNKLKKQVEDLEQRVIEAAEAELAAEEAARNTASPSKAKAADTDDLTVIKGIGNIIAAKLNEYGIKSLRQLSELSEADIRQLDEQLGPISGRIERDNWIGQAKDLLSK